MDQFLERHNLPKLTQEETGNLSRPESILKIESILNNIPKQKAPGPGGSLVNPTKHSRMKLYQFSTVSSEDRSIVNTS